MSYEPTDFKKVLEIANQDVETLQRKDQSYGSSWRRRGGVGAFMMLARKWDRIEQQASLHGYDIFAAHDYDPGTEGILDDIADLRCYLLLVEEHIVANSK